MHLSRRLLLVIGTGILINDFSAFVTMERCKIQVHKIYEGLSHQVPPEYRGLQSPFRVC